MSRRDDSYSAGDLALMALGAFVAGYLLIGGWILLWEWLAGLAG